MDEYIVTPHQHKIISTIFDLSKREDIPYATVQEVAKEMSKPESSIRTTIYGLLKRGFLSRPFRGAYILSDQGKRML
jgi:Mn-dependent DtxR family transcriptional regulator